MGKLIATVLFFLSPYIKRFQAEFNPMEYRFACFATPQAVDTLFNMFIMS